MQGAKSAKGVWGNLKFIVNFKLWATLIVFVLGIFTGGLLCGSWVALSKDWGGLSPEERRFAVEFQVALDEADREFDRIVLASTGRVSKKDWCHKSGDRPGRHWHWAKNGRGIAKKYGNKNEAGPCLDGIRLRRHGLCAQSRVAFAKAKRRGGRVDWRRHAEALKRCIQGLDPPAHR